MIKRGDIYKRTNAPTAMKQVTEKKSMSMTKTGRLPKTQANGQSELEAPLNQDLQKPMVIFTIRGQPIHFLVNTGATHLVLQESPGLLGIMEVQGATGLLS